MEIALSPEQELFRQTTREAAEELAPVTRVRELVDDELGFDRETWRRGAEIGWYALLVPEEHGGGSLSEHGLVDAAIVAEELGRAAHPGPFQSANVVAAAIAESGSAAQREERLEAIAGGELIPAWARVDVSARPLTATRDGDGWLLSGAKTAVADANAAELLLVSATGADGPIQFLVPASTDGLSVHRLESLDVARRFGRVEFDGVRVGADAVLGDPAGAAEAIERQLQVALVLQLAESNGATAKGLEMTVDYVLQRVSFGQLLGSRQAVQHRLADWRMFLEGGYATASAAAHAVAERSADAAKAVRIAKAFVGHWSTVILHDCLQLHGGIGMTWDYDLHLYFRRVISNEALLGTPEEHQRALVDLVEGIVR